MKLSFLFLSLAFFSQIASAGTLSLEKGNRSIEGVNIAKSATLNMSGSSEKLDYIGSGLRLKKVLIANVKVYVAQLFLDNAGKFVRTSSGAVKSLSDMKAGAIHLTFLRSVDASTVQVSFRDAFDANNVDLNNKGIAAFLAAVKEGADAQNGKSMNISLQKDDKGVVTVVYENTSGVEKTIKGDNTLFNGIMSIWIGEPADTGLSNLKSAILKGE